MLELTDYIHLNEPGLALDGVYVTDEGIACAPLKFDVKHDAKLFELVKPSDNSDTAEGIGAIMLALGKHSVTVPTLTTEGRVPYFVRHDGSDTALLKYTDVLHFSSSTYFSNCAMAMADTYLKDYPNATLALTYTLTSELDHMRDCFTVRYDTVSVVELTPNGDEVLNSSLAAKVKAEIRPLGYVLAIYRNKE